MLICSNCGNAEPDGSRFCGNCSAPLAPASPRRCKECQAPADLGDAFCAECGAALATETSPAGRTVEQQAPVESDEPPAPVGKRRLRWLVAGATVALVVAGGAIAAVVALTGDGSNEAVTTEPTQPSESPGILPPASSTTLADSIAPSFVELVGYQGALSARIRQLDTSVDSFAALRQAADSVVASIAGTQAALDRFAPTNSTESATMSLFHRALAEHRAYAQAISGLSRQPRSFTDAQARETIARAEQVQIAYAMLAAAEPAMSGIALNGVEHARLLTLVATPTPPASTAARRVIDLVPLLVGIRPDDPVGRGRCFGPFPGASLRVSGVVYRRGFIQCGDDADGDPSRASGVYAFYGPRFPGQARLVRMTGQAVIDEFSALSQRGSRVTWTVLYAGTPVCSRTVVWRGSRPRPRELDCRIPAAASSSGFDVRLLRVQQVASLASGGTFWAGLFKPVIVVEPL